MSTEKGRWITVHGKHIFLSDDVAEKQEKEISESKKRADEYNKSRQTQEDPVKTNALFKGLSFEAEALLRKRDSDFESLTDKSTALYGLLGKFAKNGIDSGDTYERLQKEARKLDAMTQMAWVNTGRYEDEAKKYTNKKMTTEAKKKAVAEKIKKFNAENKNPNANITPYGAVYTISPRKGKSDAEYVDEFKKAFTKAGGVYFVDGTGASLDDPMGIITEYKDWKNANPQQPKNFSWGWFTDDAGKHKLWFFEPD